MNRSVLMEIAKIYDLIFQIAIVYRSYDVIVNIGIGNQGRKQGMIQAGKSHNLWERIIVFAGQFQRF